MVDKNATDVELRLLADGRVPTAPDERFDVVLLLYVLHHAADDMLNRGSFAYAGAALSGEVLDGVMGEAGRHGRVV